MRREAEKRPEEEHQYKAWMPELSFTTVLSIIGIGFTAVDMFMRYYKYRTEEVVPTKAAEPYNEPPPSKIPVPKETTNNKIEML